MTCELPTAAVQVRDPFKQLRGQAPWGASASSLGEQASKARQPPIISLAGYCHSQRSDLDSYNFWLREQMIGTRLGLIASIAISEIDRIDWFLCLDPIGELMVTNEGLL